MLQQPSVVQEQCAEDVLVGDVRLQRSRECLFGPEGGSGGRGERLKVVGRAAFFFVFMFYSLPPN